MNKKSPLFLIYIITKLSIGFIFAYAGFVKLIEPKAFAKVISQYDIVPDILLPYFAIGLPAIELIAGLGLIFNLRGSLFVVFFLLMLFLSVLGYGIFNNMNVDCGCFSQEEINGMNSLKVAFYRDIIMMAAVIFIFSYKKYLTKNRSLRLKTNIKEERG
ncbi:MAG: hypothetical protein HXY52_08485 [Nitrospirae bacterium]|jgi:hypothetical protein|nr:hypothetical protein [Nitrospirota bacterium]